MASTDNAVESELSGLALALVRDGSTRAEAHRAILAAAGGRHDLRVRAAGTLAGWWLARPATMPEAVELGAAHLLLSAGPVDGDQLAAAVELGLDRGERSRQSYDPSR